MEKYFRKKSVSLEQPKQILKKEHTGVKAPPPKMQDPNVREYGRNYDIYNDKLKNDPYDDDD
ncbi:MAG: hypothetical protein KC713_08195 [Candidatus Omnitrophica bacterium]|nr:hypothetical protein [Candidatus Omnitrophota bacterium]